MQDKALITGNDYRGMIVGAYSTFLREYESINALNVFPVPDGDTGTNMLMTLTAVAKAIQEAPDAGIGTLSKRAADSAIMGARGNSGVILSQFFRGIARGLSGKEQASSSELAKAFQYGILYAYRAVAQPVEGTILTVAKGIAKGARRAVREDMPIVDILTEAIQAGQTELARTPDLLPALKDAGVVDAGGKGLIAFLTGCLEGLGAGYRGPEASFDYELRTPVVNKEEIQVARPYCTEVVIKNCSVNTNKAKEILVAMGDSLVLAGGDGILKVHVHTDHPGRILETAITWGTLHDIKIDNMADQHRENLIKQPEESAKTGLMVISVAAGEGLSKILRKLGSGVVISGGQTMNPPVEEFVDAIYKGSAQKYIILPNNKNIILAANQVKKLLGNRVEVVPTTNISQGFAALMAFDAKESLETNVAKMTERIKSVQSGAVTIAVRDTVISGLKVTSGHYIGIVDGKIVSDYEELEPALLSTAKRMLNEESEILALYYGAEIAEDVVQNLADSVRAAFPDVEVETYYGGQPHYQFFISVE